MPSQRLYERIALRLAAEIDSGTYPVGQRLPSERLLAQSFGVSRATVREALIALELDGLVDVRTGHGVVVLSRTPNEGVAKECDIGPFELLEARRAIESEACAMAAARVTDVQLIELSALIEEMRSENEHDVQRSENADRRFHELIAAATENSAMMATVQLLWDARTRSPQNRSMSAKVQALGIKPRIEEHVLILRALEKRDPALARDAMREHLTRVLDATFEATETEVFEQTRAQLEQQRKRYAIAR